MHTIRGGWIGQPFALATSSDAGGRKSRIRRTKEERKKMVESFIKRYQKSNNGNFPSLNLTHKEVGGSFYTVREIVREVIQENRVLAPPKESLEHDQFGFLEQQSLGSTPMQQQNDLSTADKLHIAIPTFPNQYQITKGEVGSGCSLHVVGPDLHGEPNNMAENEASIPHYHQDMRTGNVLHTGKLMPSSISNEFEIENIVNEGQVLCGNVNSDEILVVSLHDQDYKESTFQPGNVIGALNHSDEQYLNKNEPIVDNNTQESEHGVYKDSAGMEILGGEKSVGKDVIEEDLDFEKLLDSISKLNDEYKDEKTMINIIEPYPDKDTEYESSFSVPDETKASSFVSEDSTITAGRINSKFQDNKKMDRMNLGTWEGASNKSGSNPVLTLVKKFLSNFLKFWTE